jgi:hypothetical protein
MQLCNSGEIPIVSSSEGDRSSELESLRLYDRQLEIQGGGYLMARFLPSEFQRWRIS